MNKGTQFIETDALLVALEEDEEALEEHMKQFEAAELRVLIKAGSRLMTACWQELGRKDLR